MSSVADAPSKSVTANQVINLSTFREFCIKQFAQLSITDKIDNGQRVFSAKLTFKTTEPFLNDIDRKVFYAVDMNNKCYVIGSNDRPYPVATQSDDHPEKGSDEQLLTVSVSYETFTPIIYIGIV